MQQYMDDMLALLGSVIGGKPIEKEKFASFDDVAYEELYRLSKRHDLSHIVGRALEDNHLLPDDCPMKAKFEKQEMTAVYRYENIQYTLEELIAALEKASVPFLPLKGSVIRQYYPEPWMRTSCDIDILVHPEDLDRAASCLTETFGYEKGKVDSHDLSLYAPNQVHVELHFDLMEDGLVKEAATVLHGVWENSKVKEGYSFFYEMSDAMYYFYHLAHMAKHIKNGGCGVRPFLDLWILDNVVLHDEEKRKILLQQGGLAKFAHVAKQVNEVWFDGAAHEKVTEKLQEYIAFGGTYGNAQTHVQMASAAKGSRAKYIWYRIFMPYDLLKFEYPVLQKRKWLMPVYQIRRWFRLVFKGRMKASIKELKETGKQSGADVAENAKFLSDLGL